MPRNAASAGNTFVIEVRAPIFQPATEIIAAFLRKKKVQVEEDEPGTFEVLTAMEQNFIAGQFDQLVLVNAFVIEVPRTIIGTEIAVIAKRIECDFTETSPCFALIGGNRRMNGISVGEKILPPARLSRSLNIV